MPEERTGEEREYYALMAKVWSVLAPYYDVIVRPMKRMRREVARLGDIGSGTRLLDVATGTGEQALAYAARGAEVIGIDLSEEMLRIARRKNRSPNLSFRWADATELPFEDGTFDLASVSFALHEMPRSIREKVVREMVRVTRPGGAVVVVDYALPASRLGSFLAFHLVKLYERDHYAEFVRTDLDALLEGAGIEVTDHRPLLRGLARATVGHRPEARLHHPVTRVQEGPSGG